MLANHPKLKTLPHWDGILYGEQIVPAYKSSLSLQLASTEEYIDGKFTGNLGEVLIRQAAFYSLGTGRIGAMSYVTQWDI